MPPEWYDFHAIARADGIDKELYRSIAASRKPYFMRYIYPDLMKQYNTYVQNAGKNAVREFGITMDELMRIDPSERTERQAEFIEYYERFMPVGLGNCVMNTICRRFEQTFDSFLARQNAESSFDYTILKSGRSYSEYTARKVRSLYMEYVKRVKDYTVFQMYEKVDEFEATQKNDELLDDFLRGCTEICPDRFALCDILLDMSYQRSGQRTSQKLVWDVCGDEIIHNLLERNGGRIVFPARDANGSLKYAGERFTLQTCIAEGYDGTDIE